MRVCEITGKSVNLANNVSHALNHTRKRQLPNLQVKRVWIPEEERFIKLTLSTRAIRSINKAGLRVVCQKHGVDYDQLLKTR